MMSEIPSRRRTCSDVENHDGPTVKSVIAILNLKRFYRTFQGTPRKMSIYSEFFIG
jgi:hypothetical protein